MVTKIADAGSLKEGSYVIVEGAACKVSDIQISKTGKHGHAKIRFTAIGILDDKKRILVMPAHDNVEVPIIEKKNAQVLSISGDIANVMDTETYENFELKIPEELKGQVVEGCIVLYWEVMGNKVMKQIKGE